MDVRRKGGPGIDWFSGQSSAGALLTGFLGGLLGTWDPHRSPVNDWQDSRSSAIRPVPPEGGWGQR
jgi:hypothetical protein